MKVVTINQVTIGSGTPKIITPIVAKTAADILLEAKKLNTLPCDLVEWRIDFFEQVQDALTVAHLSQEIKKLLAKPLLITFRSQQEGGECPLSDTDYTKLYHTLLNEGQLDLLDIELFMPQDIVSELIYLAHQKQVKVILCNHDFQATPEKAEIIRRLQLMQDLDADICKIAVMPQTPQDVLTLLAATEEMQRCFAKRPLITMSMGRLGQISRLTGELFGSAATFASDEQASAPGQINVKQLPEILKILHLH